MGPFFSPRVPGSETAGLTVRTRRNVQAVSCVSLQLIKHLPLLLLFSSACLWASPALAQAPTERVLIVTGYDPGYPSVSILLRSLTATIRNGSKGRVEFFYEFQENLRIDNSKYEREMVSYLQRKYEGENINLVLVQFETPAFWALYKWYVIFF